MLSQRKPLLPPDTRDQLLVQNPALGLGEACSRSLADLEGSPVLGVIAGESLHVVRFTYNLAPWVCFPQFFRKVTKEANCFPWKYAL